VKLLSGLAWSERWLWNVLAASENWLLRVLGNSVRRLRSVLAGNGRSRRRRPAGCVNSLWNVRARNGKRKNARKLFSAGCAIYKDWSAKEHLSG